MPTPITETYINIGEYYEDCGFHPCLCIHLDGDRDEILGISFVDGSAPRSCSLVHCGIRKLDEDEVLHWKFFGPADKHTLPKDMQWWHVYSDQPWCERFRLPPARA